jgi:hypothetical protein
MEVRSRTRAIALIGGLVSGLLAFAGISAVVWVCASTWGKTLYSRNPSAGDSFGWAVVISLPVLSAAILGVSIGVGVLTHNRMKRSQ